jgi:hypothetical protein
VRSIVLRIFVEWLQMLQGLLDSKKEYVQHLCDVFAEPMVGCFQRLYNECMTKPEARGKGILTVFQDQLSSIPSWNINLIKEEFGAAKQASMCSYISELIKAILVTYVKISILSNDSKIDTNSIQLRVPSGESFYHRCLIICARELWKQPYLLYHKVRSIEMQRNLNEVELLARKAIKSAIRLYIPLDQLVSSICLDTTAVSKKQQQQSSSESENEEESDAATSSSDEESDAESCDERQEDEESVAATSSSGEESAESCDEHDERQESQQNEEDSDEQVETSEEESEADDEEIVESISEGTILVAKDDADSVHSDTTETFEEETHKSIELDTELKTVHEPNSPVVLSKLKHDDEERNDTNVQQSRSKVLYGSMLLNNLPIKKHKPSRRMKSDAFF